MEGVRNAGRKTLKDIFDELGKQEALKEIVKASDISPKTLIAMAEGFKVSIETYEKVKKAINDILGIDLLYEVDCEKLSISAKINTWLEQYFKKSRKDGYSYLAHATGGSIANISKIANGSRKGSDGIVKKILTAIQEKPRPETIKPLALPEKEIIPLAIKTELEKLDRRLRLVEYKFQWLADIFAQDEPPDTQDETIRNMRQEILGLAEKLKKYSSCLPEESSEREKVRQALLKDVHLLFLSIMEFDKTNPSELQDVYAGFRAVMGIGKKSEKKRRKK